MSIVYRTDKKDLPCEPLRQLFVSAGWSDDEEDAEVLAQFNIPFIHSTLVVSAWDDERLVGAVRVLSDTIIRSVVYDLVVLPVYRNKGIGKALLRHCMEHFPGSEWLIQTTAETASYYEQLGFDVNKDVFLTIPSVYNGQTG